MGHSPCLASSHASPGVRRAGKTFICRQLLSALVASGSSREQTLYVNLEEPFLQPALSVRLLDDLYETYRHYLNPGDPCYIVLDEVQNIPGWEKWVRMMLERSEPAKIVVTGSSSRIVQQELATVLTGRYIEVRVYPLSFREFLTFRQVRIENLDIREKELTQRFSEYLEFGGFPTAVCTDRLQMRREFLKDLFDSIVTRDIGARYGLRRIQALKAAAVLQFQSIPAPVSVQELSRALRAAGTALSPTTVNGFLAYFPESLLFVFVPIFSYKAKERMQYPRKAYCVDTGLANAAALRFSENAGRMAENAVAMELFRRYGPENVFYWKGEGKEVDFAVVSDARPRLLVQVAWTLDAVKTKEREIQGLAAAMKEFGKIDALILTASGGVGAAPIPGIRHQSTWRWLLGESDASNSDLPDDPDLSGECAAR
ncbi:MAG: ATP-binding protein [Methanomicrobiales archaeon]|nr:ATP-binding protein [Methanomicrobiales archaeon]